MEDLYRKSLDILAYVEQQRDAEDKQLYTVKEYKKKILDKYGRYEYKKKNMKLARELFGQSADIAEELVRNAKISADIQTIQISLCYVMLTGAADDCEKGKIQNRLQCIEKWLKQSKVYDRTVESQFEDMKRKWM